MGPLILSHSVLLSSEYFSECGTLNSAELNICCNIHSVQLSRGEGLYSAPLSISNLPLERFGDVYFEKMLTGVGSLHSAAKFSALCGNF